MHEKRFNIVDGDAENYLLNLLMFSFANRLHKYLHGFPKFKSTFSSFEVAADKPCFKLFLAVKTLRDSITDKEQVNRCKYWWICYVY